MPKTTREGKVRKSELPDTLKRSPAKAQRQFATTPAYASLKHDFEKVGDHWEAKDEPGPSDPRSTKTTREKREGKGETYGGVDEIGNTKQELYDRAKRLGIEGRSKMSKRELAKAIARRQ
jgi:hypothetical protein